VELSWTGESKELSSGNSWAVTCEEGDVGDKMVIEVDVTKFRVQPFRSYKVCINLEDSPTNSHLDEVCSHLFSFEKYVPYIPEEEKINKVKSAYLNEEEEQQKMLNELEEEVVFTEENSDIKVINSSSLLINENNESDMSNDYLEKSYVSDENHINKDSIESVLKHQLKDIENFVRDDYKADFLNVENEIREEIDFALKYSSSSKSCLSFILLLCLVIVNILIY